MGPERLRPMGFIARTGKAVLKPSVRELRFRGCSCGGRRELRRSAGEAPGEDDRVSSSQLFAVFLFSRYALCVFVVKFRVFWAYLAAKMVPFCCLSVYASLLMQFGCFRLTLFQILMFRLRCFLVESLDDRSFGLSVNCLLYCLNVQHDDDKRVGWVQNAVLFRLVLVLG